MRIATQNADKTLDAARAAAVVRRVARATDVVLWQEIGPKHRDALRALEGWVTWHPGSPWGLAISWRTDRAAVVRRGKVRRVVPGIRSVDPVRGCADIVLRDLTSGEVFAVLTAHMTHQAWTSHRERRPRWQLQARRLRRRTSWLARRWGAAVGGGDLNRDHWAPTGSTGHWAGPTYGAQRYDVLWTYGGVRRAGPVTDIRTTSDHDGLVATFERTS